MTRNFERFSGNQQRESAATLLHRLEELSRSEENNDIQINAILSQLERNYPRVYAERVQIIEDTRENTVQLRQEVGQTNPDIIEVVGSDGRVRQVLIKRESPSPRSDKPTTPERRQVAQGPSRAVNDTNRDKNGTPLPPELINDKGLREQLQKLGILRGNNVVFEDPKWKEEFRKYVDMLGFLKKAKYSNSKAFSNSNDRKKAISNYISLSNETASFFLFDKRYLQLQYATALYNDIIGNGHILEKTKNNTFVIKSITTGKETNNSIPEYNNLLSGPNQNKLLDVAMVIGIMENNFSFDNNIVGQRTFVQKILEQNGIKSPNGSIVQANLLKLEWEDVKTQILSKREASVKGNPKNFQNYQELTYVLNFVDNEEYLKKDYNEEIMSLANTFRIQYRGEKSALDAMQRSGFDADKPETYGNLIKNITAENAPLLIVAAIFLALIGKGSWSAGIIGALVGGYVGGSALNQISQYGGKPARDKLELLDFNNLIPVINVDKKYQPILAGLVEENSVRSTNPQERKPSIKNPFILGKIYYELLKSDADGDLSTSPENVKKVFNSLPNKKITGVEFNNHESGLNGKEVTENDVRVFLSILGEKKDSTDVTLRDALEPGKDPLGKIENLSYTNDNILNTELNKLLTDGFSNLDRTKKRERIQLQERLVNELKNTDKAKVDALITKLKTESFNQKYIILLQDYSLSLDLGGKLKEISIPPSFGNSEASIEEGKKKLEIVESQIGAIENDTRLKGRLLNGSPVIQEIVRKVNDIKKEITEKKTSLSSSLDRLQSLENAKDVRARFGGEVGGRVDRALVGKNEGYFRSVFDGENHQERQLLRESIRATIGFLNRQLKEVEESTSLFDMNLILGNPNSLEAFDILKTLSNALISSTGEFSGAKKYLKEVSQNEFGKYKENISRLYNEKYRTITSNSNTLQQRINDLNIDNIDIEGYIATLGSLRGEVNNLQRSSIRESNEVLSKLGITGLNFVEINTNELVRKLEEKEGALAGKIEREIEAAKRDTNNIIYRIQELGKIERIENLSQESKTRIFNAQKEILESVIQNTPFNTIPGVIGSLQELKRNNVINENLKRQVDVIISGMREKFKTQTIDSFNELNQNGDIIKPIIESLLLRSDQSRENAQRDLNKITTPTSLSLKEFDEIVTRWSLGSSMYTEFMKEKKLID